MPQGTEQQNKPWYRRDIPPVVISIVAIAASSIGIILAFMSLVGVPSSCGFSLFGMAAAILSVSTQVAWWIDRFGFYSSVVPTIVFSLLMLSAALFFVKVANPVCDLPLPF